MTKKIRIENADISNHKVKVIVQRKDAEGQWADVPAEEADLSSPTQLAEKWVHSHQRIIIEES